MFGGSKASADKIHGCDFLIKGLPLLAIMIGSLSL